MKILEKKPQKSSSYELRTHLEAKGPQVLTERKFSTRNSTVSERLEFHRKEASQPKFIEYAVMHCRKQNAMNK